ncbi:MAG: beta-eliminating lyase-related protein [Erysipelotrichales bacterium]
MYSFVCDYGEGAHPQILKAMVSANLVQTDGYGEDQFCDKARSLIKQHLNNNNVDIYFVSGGTQANIISISSSLKQYEAIIAAESAHISTSETGAIEATGHKVIELPTNDGKINAQQVADIMEMHLGDVHNVLPKAVFISNSTEIGTIYSKEELLAIRETCNRYGLYMYLDGARLGTALVSANNNLSMSDLCDIFDIFYIGGTKNGAWLGEAIVVVNDNLKPNFRYNIKQKGALFAKGKLLGIQFIELFEQDLYFKLAQHSTNMGIHIRNAFISNGYQMFSDSYTNQQFVVIPNEMLAKFDEKYRTTIWCPYDENSTVVRFVTSWATNKEMVAQLVEDIKKFKE